MTTLRVIMTRIFSWLRCVFFHSDDDFKGRPYRIRGSKKRCEWCGRSMAKKKPVKGYCSELAAKHIEDIKTDNFDFPPKEEEGEIGSNRT